MNLARAAPVGVVAVAVGLALASGASTVDPQTPPALSGLPPPFLGTAVVGDGGMTGAVDSYGDVVDLRAGPAGRPLIENPAARQAAGTVDVAAGIVPRVSVGGGAALPLWRADAVSQSYLAGTNVVRTVARFGAVRVVVAAGATKAQLAMRVTVNGAGAIPTASVEVDNAVRCRRERHPGQFDLLCQVGRVVPDAASTQHPEEEVDGVDALLDEAARDDRAWLARARALGPGAPAWARRLYERSLLVLRALTAPDGAVSAGARDGWAYVWPRDAGTAALAYASAGYPAEARRVARFLLGLDLTAAARFDGRGEPIPGRPAQGDAAGWVAVAARAAGLPLTNVPNDSTESSGDRPATPWHDRADYRESNPGNFLANAIASAPGVSDLSRHIWRLKSDTPPSGPLDAAEIATRFGTARGLVREEGGESGLDSAAAWAVRPFGLRALYPAARETLRQLATARTPYGITPGEDWDGGVDPWTAPTAWSAWALAALAADSPGGRNTDADRRLALALLGDLRRAATPAGVLPERVDASTGVPRSTTPLAWSHAFAILALRELWPRR